MVALYKPSINYFFISLANSTKFIVTLNSIKYLAKNYLILLKTTRSINHFINILFTY